MRDLSRRNSTKLFHKTSALIVASLIGQVNALEEDPRRFYIVIGAIGLVATTIIALVLGFLIRAYKQR